MQASSVKAIWEKLRKEPDMVLGLGTGTTVEHFCSEMTNMLADGEFAQIAVSSLRTQRFLEKRGIQSVLMRDVSKIDIYLDGVDYIDTDGIYLKGGGGAMTGERLCIDMAERFEILVHEKDASKKCVAHLSPAMPLVIEVVSWARASLGRRILSLGGRPILRNQKTELDNDILDCYGLSYANATEMESTIAQCCGVVGHGLFAKKKPDTIHILEG